MIGHWFGYQTIFFIFGTVTMLCFIFNSIYMIETKTNIKLQINVELAKLQFDIS